MKSKTPKMYIGKIYKSLLFSITFHLFFGLNWTVFSQCAPVLDLPFSGNALDISGNNNHGIPGGTPTLVPDRFGNPNSAYEFGGVGDVDFFTVTNNPTIQFANQISISYWFKQCSFQGMNGWGQTVPFGYHIIMAKIGDGFSAAPGIWNGLSVDPTTYQLNWGICNKNGYNVTPNFCVNSTFNCINSCEWVHVVVVFDNTNCKTYFNGQLVVNETINQVDFTVSNTHNLLIGKMDGIWYPYRGTIDDIKIYNCSIDETTVASLFGNFADPNNNNVTPTFTQIPPICPGQNFTLPTTSQNNITGTWSPAVNNQQTTTYVFTPSAGQCANSTQMTVAVGDPVTPTFTQLGPFNSGENFSLPTTSNNGITGTWSPVANNQQTTTYTFTPAAGACATTTTMTVVINSLITPLFNQIAPICAGSNISPLPYTSVNGIIGTWSPSFNNQQTTIYTFTPNPGQSSTTSTMTITVNPMINPTLTQVQPICAGANLSALPTTSNNGIAGTWSPDLNNQQTTTYFFEPLPAQCAVTSSMIIEVLPIVSPEFPQIAPICSGAPINPLPLTSINGILGIWSPDLNNTVTTTYYFTPYDGQCANESSITIVVNPILTPVFDVVAPICEGATLNNLPSISNNGVVGNWSPALNNQQTTTYTFTPSAGQCANPATMTITVNPMINPTFTQVQPICAGASLSTLPTTSNNGIAGAWSPDLNNLETTTYTFTPSENQCSSQTTMTIQVNPYITPNFTQVQPICVGATLSALPTLSNNGISGTWSPMMNNQQTTTYFFTPNSEGCVNSAFMTIVVNPILTPTFAQVAPICIHANLNALPVISTNGYSGSWSPALNNSQTTTYTFMPNQSQCATPTTMTIVVHPTHITFDTLNICESQLPFIWHDLSLSDQTDTVAILQNQWGCDSIVYLRFQVIPTQYSAFSTQVCSNKLPYEWGGEYFYLSGTYVRTRISQQGCDSIVTMTFNVLEAPIVDFSVEPWTGCLPLELTFVNDSITENAAVQWSFGNGQTSTNIFGATALYNEPGCYDVSLAVTHQNGCTSVKVWHDSICFQPKPIASFWMSSEELSALNPVVFLQNNSQNAYTTLWDFGDGSLDSMNFSVVHEYLDSVKSYIIVLHVFNEHNCADSSYQILKVKAEPIYFVPNSFTPNGDGLNDEFKPVLVAGMNIEAYHLLVFNRWGEIVFETRSILAGWDGTFLGEVCQDGIYVFQMEYKDPNRVENQFVRGHVSLIR